jgi:hypothetical protein
MHSDNNDKSVIVTLVICLSKISSIVVSKRIHGDLIYLNVPSRVCPGQKKRISPLPFVHGCRKKRLKD